MSTELKPLRLIKKDNKYSIGKYVKTIDLVEIEPEKVNALKKLQRKMWDDNPIYNQLSNRQKRVLHTVAPIWANILSHKMGGSMIVTDDSGKRYSLDSADSHSCLVGEVYGFGYTTCGVCHGYNMNFASLNSVDMRNSIFLGIINDLKGFLDHYYEKHLLPKIEESHSVKTDVRI